MNTSVSTVVDIHSGERAGSRENLDSPVRPHTQKRRRTGPHAKLSIRPIQRQLSSFISKGPSVDDTIYRAQQGDAEAFETLYGLHSRRVYALCLRMIGDPADAEDLTQEAFLQLFRKIHTFRGESAFSSWLYRLTANVVLMRFRKRKPVTLSLDELTRAADGNEHPLVEIGAPDLRLAGVFDRVKLHDALAQLPAGYKSMFLLHDVQGYEHNEIARLLGCSIGNSKSQLHKARKRLRQLLQRGRRGPAPTQRKSASRAEALGFASQLENYAT